MRASGGWDRDPPHSPITVLEYVAKVLAAIATGFILIVSVVMLADSLARTIFMYPVPELYEYTTALQVAIILGAGLALSSGRTSANRLRFLHDRAEAVVYLVFLVLVAFPVVAWVSVALFEQTERAYTMGDVSLGLAGYPIWLKLVVLVTGFCAIALQLIGELLRAIQCLSAGAWPRRDPALWQNAQADED